MTNRDRQAEAISDFLLQLLFPDPRTVSTAAATIGFDQQLRGLRIAFQSLSRTPVGNIIHRKGGRVGGLTHVDGALIVPHIVDAVGHGLAQGIVRKVMHVDEFWALAPGAPSVLEVTDQFFLLVSTLITGLRRRQMLGALLNNVLELGVAFRLSWTTQLFGVSMQMIVMSFQQAPNHWPADAMPLRLELFLKIVQTAIEPFGVGHRIASCMRLD